MLNRNENEFTKSDAISERRDQLGEALLSVLIQSIPFSIEDPIREAIRSQSTGSWVLPDGLVSPELFNGVTWIHPSLYWMWQADTETYCLNFSAQEAHFHVDKKDEDLRSAKPFGSAKDIQWTLEASHSKDKEFIQNEVDEVRRYEPCIEDTTLTRHDANIRLGRTTITCFWKVADLKLLCVQLEDVSLSGSIIAQHQGSRGNMGEPKGLDFRSNLDNCHTQLQNGPVLTCNGISLISALPSSSEDHIHLAQIMSLLEPWKTPGLIWKSPPVPHLGGVKYGSLSDVYRHVYSFLEDMDEDCRKVSTQSSIDEHAPQEAAKHNSRGLARINWKSSVADSLAITGGLVATGASFVTPIGAAVAVAAVGVKDGVAAAAQKGQESRKGGSYKVGDVTRGVVATIQERRSQRKIGSLPESDEVSGTGNVEDRGFVAKSGRYVSVVGSSLGAAVGRSFTGGAVGSLAGSIVGSAATQESLRRNEERSQSSGHGNNIEQNGLQAFQSADDEIMRQLEHGANRSNEDYLNEMDKKPWEFGDRIRNVVQRGKKASGRSEDSTYRIGDFSRGLFSKK